MSATTAPLVVALVQQPRLGRSTAANDWDGADLSVKRGGGHFLRVVPIDGDWAAVTVYVMTATNRCVQSAVLRDVPQAAIVALCSAMVEEL